MFEVLLAWIQEGFLYLAHDAPRLRAIGPIDLAIFVADFPANSIDRLGRVRVGREKEGKEKRTEKRKGKAYPFIMLNRISLSRLAFSERNLFVSKNCNSKKLFLLSGSAGGASRGIAAASSAILSCERKKW